MSHIIDTSKALVEFGQHILIGAPLVLLAVEGLKSKYVPVMWFTKHPRITTVLVSIITTIALVWTECTSGDHQCVSFIQEPLDYIAVFVAITAVAMIIYHASNIKALEPKYIQKNEK